MVVRMEGLKQSLQWPLHNFHLHTRFYKEGKATISLQGAHTNLMMSNAPPNQLLVFLKVLASKKAAAAAEDTEGGSKALSARQRLLSSRPATFEEISPLTLKVIIVSLTVLLLVFSCSYSFFYHYYHYISA